MNLIIDAGNSLVKLAVFQSNNLIVKDVVSYEAFFNFFSKIRREYPEIDKIILSSVSRFNIQALMDQVENHDLVVVLDHKTKMPFINKYTTPTTLGVDRLALMAAAAVQYPNQNSLVIDMGTCITYDFLNSKNEYYGGGISPGLQLRYKSLNDHTANLPLLSAQANDILIGGSTNEAIHAGIYNGFISEINGIIQQFSNTYDPLIVILTGGDINFLSKRLKSGIFVDQNFLFKGLNFILDFNTSK